MDNFKIWTDSGRMKRPFAIVTRRGIKEKKENLVTLSRVWGEKHAKQKMQEKQKRHAKQKRQEKRNKRIIHHLRIFNSQMATLASLIYALASGVSVLNEKMCKTPI